jgi:hypothetical protein
MNQQQSEEREIVCPPPGIVAWRRKPDRARRERSLEVFAGGVGMPGSRGGAVPSQVTTRLPAHPRTSKMPARQPGAPTYDRGPRADRAGRGTDDDGPRAA